ncbi:thioesterase II family protein [Flavobacterium collinsii]|uniref:Thioesterase PikA5 n=1 Tax=Flavobacterium collinsii TaxID=1114861 RepID=A0A9W4X3J0_9FLAO|nr:alpha/beta fold hydrolase [Flavobacterium collinsii]CAI2767085.1 Thioesterase PikA5 [Flavobacterium collinsii]
MYSNQKIQIFLLHFAGGSCYSFDFLKNDIQNNFECHALELPGRGKRNQEPCVLSKSAAVKDYVFQIKKRRSNNQPYIIYGHSMGATLGLSVTKKMEELSDPPTALIVSGNAGPGVYGSDLERHTLSDPEFKKELRSLGGVPEQILEDEDLYNYFSPIMRADFEILEKEKHSEIGLILNTPIFAVMGDEEKTAPEIENWKQYTNRKFDYRVVPGNHFFIHRQVKTLTQIITECAADSLVSL